ncbi:MAG: hypothetical protein KAR32_03000 [Candidatus Omnitrophica bacterium]|nr:hypothetical protein [Candidatus Omnitrophota bacterium]
MDNAITFPEYWRNSVTDENRETVCMAEQFAKLAAEDGEKWLQDRSVEFIDKCRELSAKDKTKYYQCLWKGVETIAKQVSSPCKELGDEGLWDEARCGRLISYIFTQGFNKVLLDNRPIVEKARDNKILKILFGPIAATILLLLYVLDVVLLTDPGNWWRIPKFGLVVGTIILVSWFLPDQWGFLGVSAAVFICVGGIIRNHIMALFKSD